MTTKCFFCKQDVEVRNTVPLLSPEQHLVAACIDHPGIVSELMAQRDYILALDKIGEECNEPK